MSDVEQKWLKKMQRVLNECPPTLGFYTIGDPSLAVYDRSKEREICAFQDKNAVDFCVAVSELDCDKGNLKFPCNVHSTAG